MARGMKKRFGSISNRLRYFKSVGGKLGLILVGSIVFFVLLMGIASYEIWLFGICGGIANVGIIL